MRRNCLMPKPLTLEFAAEEEEEEDDDDDDEEEDDDDEEAAFDHPNDSMICSVWEGIKT